MIPFTLLEKIGSIIITGILLFIDVCIRHVKHKPKRILRIHNIIWNRGWKLIIWTTSIKYILVSSLIVFLESLSIKTNINTILPIILFIYGFIIEITLVKIVSHNIMTLRPIIIISVCIMTIVFFVYLIGGASAIFMKNKINVNSLSIILLFYFPILTIPFGIGSYRKLNNIIIDNEIVFKGENKLRIYSPVIFDLITVFGIIITFVSMLSSNPSKFSIIYIYIIVYLLTPISLITIEENAYNRFVDIVKNFSISCKINNMYKLYLND